MSLRNLYDWNEGIQKKVILKKTSGCSSCVSEARNRLTSCGYDRKRPSSCGCSSCQVVKRPTGCGSCNVEVNKTFGYSSCGYAEKRTTSCGIVDKSSGCGSFTIHKRTGCLPCK